MPFWCLKVGLLVTVWCVSVLWCDVQSASILQRQGSVLEVVFFTNFVGCFFTTGACLLLRRGSFTDMRSLACTLYERPMMWRLLLSVASVNVMATWCMFLSFTFSGMTHVYAVKTTEPLLMCLLSMECTQKLIKNALSKGRSAKDPFADVEEYPLSTKLITFRTWMCVLIVCIGAFLTSGSLKRNTNTSFGILVLLFTYSLVLVSNCALALRTTLMKPLLHVLPDESSVFSSCSIYVFMSMLGSSALVLPVLVYRGKHLLEYDMDTWKQFLVVGLSYGTYQACNGMVLFHVTPLAYSILKQVRVVLIFFFSLYYFGKEIESTSQLFIGLILLFSGTYCYAAV
ncbi:hypothetical protein DQ04_02081160 [Trypanosoma grayi]|uniref:hypothetical protein n=1 Tax=Trypanosoma grayi TaxID=71804 RepID=UPI0004F4519B|nr:hypothetical protein DQ04_02081160 [Trypanosoma grayi]KEG12013.1 hypothetical protein DQ04_02081160 [Trypanosoma grayi]